MTQLQAAVVEVLQLLAHPPVNEALDSSRHRSREPCTTDVASQTSPIVHSVRDHEIQESVGAEVNLLSLDELRERLFCETLMEKQPGFLEVDVDRSQGRGASADQRWTCDVAIQDAAITAVGNQRFLEGCSGAKLQATRPTKLRAFLRVASTICQPWFSITSLLDPLTAMMARIEHCYIDGLAFRDAWTTVESWMHNPDNGYLRQLGLKLSKHPGFDARRGWKKRDHGARFARVLQSALQEEPWALKLCHVFSHGTRSRLIPLKECIPVRSPNQIMTPVE
eukprot:134522-Amphidinium_carterae.1